MVFPINEDFEQDYWGRFDYEAELYADDIESLKDEGANYECEEDG